MSDPQRDPLAARSFETVLSDELDAVSVARAGRGDRSEFEGDDALERSRDARLFALAFSGGGIRSAIFNLGVAQGLARLGLLSRLDYLSVNSGGGYMGGWLAAWIRRHADGVRGVERELAAGAVGRGPEEDEQAASDPDGERSADRHAVGGHEPRPLRFLRRFSNYLTPQVGALSADTWTMVSEFFRNFLLNLSVLVLALGSILLMPRFVAWVSLGITGTSAYVPLGLAAVLLFVAIAFMGLNQLTISPIGKRREDDWFTSQGAVQWTVVIPLVLCGWLAGLWSWMFTRAEEGDEAGRTLARSGNRPLVEWVGETLGSTPSWLTEPLAWALGGMVIYGGFWSLVSLFHWVLGRWRVEEPRRRVLLDRLWTSCPLGAIAAGFLGGLLIYALLGLTYQLEIALHPPGEFDESWHVLHVVAFRGPLIVIIFKIAAYAHIGLMGRDVPETLRQWWSRLGAWLLIYSITWLVLFFLAFYGPMLLIFLGGLAATGLSLGWLGSTLGGVLVGRQAAQSGDKPGGWRGLVIGVAPQIFIFGLLALIALGLHVLLSPASASLADGCQSLWTPQGPSTAEHLKAVIGCQTERLWYGIGEAPVLSWLPLVLLALAAAVLSMRVDINEFSMHLFYRNRLIRAFLGASNPRRQAQEFTGFDPDDDLALAELSPVDAIGRPTDYDGPYLISNAALNLVGGQELAWQERKAASFVFTPLATGYLAGSAEGLGEGDAPVRGARHAYRPTWAYGTSVRERQAICDARRSLREMAAVEDEVNEQEVATASPSHGITLGTAMAISGAAASPSQGAGTTPAMAFLLTVFNVRLGWWLGNPRRRTWHRMGPWFGLLALLSELFGATDESSEYVYLSDGGHFDNTALYELVRRRTRFVLATDATADPESTFEDLGNAIRKCATDFGVAIELETERVVRDPETGRSLFHCAVGTIRYDLVEPGTPPGTLLYLKASLTGDEPGDVINYAAEHPDFPHEPTADQWFGESQFESYRRLGEHVALVALEGACRDPDGEALPIEAVFVRLAETWTTGTGIGGSVYEGYGARVDALYQRLTTEPELRFLARQIFPEWRRLVEDPGMNHEPETFWLPEGPDGKEGRRAGFAFCCSLLNLMVGVHRDLDLDETHQHPSHRGWMNLFAHWAWPGMMKVTWALTASTFNPGFQRFVERYFGLALGDVVVEDVPLPPGEEAAAVDRVESESSINFLEADLARGVIAARSADGLAVPDRLLVLRLAVEAPTNVVDGSKVSGLRSTFGVALAVGSELVYLRVQDHLRRMGLGRSSLATLLAHGGVTGLVPTEDVRLDPWSHDKAGEAQVDEFERLFRSVRDIRRASSRPT